MAKEKGGFKPADLKKHYFWIVLPLLVILALVFSFIARSSIKKAYEEKTTAITSAKEGADSVASDKKHPNDATIKAIKDETKILSDNVYNAWELMYNDQKIRNRWPRQLTSEFLDLVENKLKFKDPIGVGKPHLLEDYGYFIGKHLPDLIKEVNRRRCQVMDYKLLKKAELNSLQLTGLDERFWPIYVDKDADGNEFLYIGIHSSADDENSPLADAFLYDHDNDIVSRFENQEQHDAILKKEKHEHYYLDVDPWIRTPKDMIIWGVQANDLQGIIQAISTAGAEGGGGAAGGGAAGGGMAGGGMMGSGMAGGGGGPRGSMGGDASMSGGMGSELSGLGIGAVPGDGVDPAYDQVVGTSLEEIGGGSLGGGAGAGMGGMGGGRAGGMGAGMTGGMGGARTTMAGGGGRSGGMGGARTSMAGGGGRSGGMGGGMMGDTMGGASAEDPSWSEKIYPGLPSYKQRRRIVGNVDWPDPEIYSLPTWEQTAAHPESIEVWYAQETLWVYEALIHVIAETNKEYPDNISKAPVKCIEQMLIGQNAAVEWLTLSQTIGDLTGKSAASMGGGLMSVDSSAMMTGSGMPGAEGGFSLSGNAEEQAMTKILTGRYIGEDNTPLKADDKPPYSEFNMMPVCLKLAIDQRHIPDLLVSCANSAMPIDVKHVRVCPDNNVPFTMPIPLENMGGGEGGAAGGGSMMMGMDMMGGGMMGGGMAGGGMGGDAAGGGRGGRGAAGGMGGAAGDMMGGMGGVEIGRSELSQTEYGVDTIRVEIYGVINIFNKPNKAAFATGASAEEADAEAEATLAGGVKTEEGAETDESSDSDTTTTPTDATATPADATTTPTDSAATPTDAAATPADATATDADAPAGTN